MGTRFTRIGLSLGGLAVIALALASGHAVLRNQLIEIDVAAETQWKQVENQLARQHELIPKLAQVATRYVEHERDVLGELFRSRSSYLEASPERRPELAREVDGGVGAVLALAERYPDLHADQQYRDLAYEIAATKNRIAVERMRYNEVVGLLNRRLRQFPWLLISGEFDARAYYEVEAEDLVEPELSL